MTAEELSFEPVHVDSCTLAPTPRMARTIRFKQLGIARGRQPVGTTVDVSRGNAIQLFCPITRQPGQRTQNGRYFPLGDDPTATRESANTAHRPNR
jgi:hypothetical protein